MYLKRNCEVKRFLKNIWIIKYFINIFLSFFFKNVSVIYISIVFKVLLLFKLNLNRKNCL